MGTGLLDKGTLQLQISPTLVCSASLAGLVCSSPSVQLICVPSTGSVHHRHPVRSQNNCIGSLICLRKCQHQAGFKTQILSMYTTSMTSRTYWTYCASSLQVSSIACYSTIHGVGDRYPACIR